MPSTALEWLTLDIGCKEFVQVMAWCCQATSHYLNQCWPRSLRGCNGNIELISTLINSELNKIADWLAVNKLSLNVQKTKFMIFHYRQRVLTENDIPCLMINDTLIERVTEFNFLGLTVNEYMNWNSHVQKIANKISRTLGVMNRLMGSHIKITKTRPSDYDK